jgi:hypothetical protein
MESPSCLLVCQLHLLFTAEAHFFSIRNNILLKSTGNSGNKSPSHSNLLVNISLFFMLIKQKYLFCLYRIDSLFYRHTSLEYFYRISFLSSYILSVYTCVIYVCSLVLMFLKNLYLTLFHINISMPIVVVYAHRTIYFLHINIFFIFY